MTKAQQRQRKRKRIAAENAVRAAVLAERYAFLAAERAKLEQEDRLIEERLLQLYGPKTEYADWQREKVTNELFLAEKPYLNSLKTVDATDVPKTAHPPQARVRRRTKNTGSGPGTYPRCTYPV